ncbi:hypothetical protein Q3O59_07690 [Alkalimonas delamerensis]|uniref:Uncharacterized protein n=1 Tax=Alkalimonas delamerensis TaxID=265981 RepID=A0ABT9GPJ9_9GAMM|nr:hypothetical protein [Alkalimonas delamerensis]MDP4528907.1 hypothetical protein [Alkalimonas delamerensis]
MNLGKIAKSSYSKAVQTLIHKIYDQTEVQDSLYEQALLYFLDADKLQQQQRAAEQEAFLYRERLQQVTGSDQAKIEQRLQQAEKSLTSMQQGVEELRNARLSQLKELCYSILEMVEGADADETNALTAKLLGSIQLLSPTEGKQVARSNQKSKHLYKAVLALRLLDRLLLDQQITNSYVLKRYQHNEGKELEVTGGRSYQPFRDDVQIPLLMAALIQDIGQQHPDAQRILRGEDGNQDEFRVLDNPERLAMLQTNYKESLKFLTQALGKDRYIGNSKDERDWFERNEQEKLGFMVTLLKNSIKPEQGIGNLLKIPQIYTSVVLSTKHNYSYESLPKVGLVVDKAVEKGMCSKAAADALMQITGIFPQGYGITFIPKDSDRQDLDRYEYAIVTALYPPHPNVPVCRMVTRNLSYQISTMGCTIRVENNLFFPQARKKLEKIKPERLKEILMKLVSNYEERKDMDLIPRCWHPEEYFSYARNQNLWNKVINQQL